MQGARRVAGIGVLILPLLVAGCALRRPSLADAFPPGSMAAPWVLEGEVWSGTLEQATPGLGADADQWCDPPPQRVWLAIYRDESRHERRLVARAFEFDSSAAARTIFERVRPVGASRFDAGDEGCWTSGGVLFLWGRVVFDVFACEPSWQNELQAAMLVQFIQKQMPRGLVDASP